MDPPQSESSPTSILNSQKVPGRDRGVPRNSLSDKATIIIAIVCPGLVPSPFVYMPSLPDIAGRPMRGGLLSPRFTDGETGGPEQ